MSEPFDPYCQWLGIEPHEQPADHYRLLGIDRFESNPTIIGTAADERMVYIRSFQMGPQAAETQGLLNEIATARICLLNPGSKASYDQLLEALHCTSDPPQFAQLVLHSDNDLLDEETTFSSRKWFLVATTSVILIGGAIALAISQQGSTEQLRMTHKESRYPDYTMHGNDDSQEESEPVLIYQEADGSVNLDASFAQLHGPTLRLGLSGNVNVISDWESMDDWVSWRFKVVKLPPQGIFHVQMTYAANPEANGGTFVIAMDGQEKEYEIRGTGEVVNDEHFIPILRSGDHDLTVHAKSKPARRLMTLKSLNFRFPE